MFAMPISMPRFKSNIFNQNSPKIKLFLFERWGQWPPAAGGFPPNQAPPWRIFSYAPGCSQNFGAKHMHMYNQVLKRKILQM